ncbi:MAG TPA: hypothetical protein VFA94_03675 [Acidimicrobiales bacterium]|nr:hypothetical protein [Acidimicrobiales bacterium]
MPRGPDLADHAFGHALLVLGDPGAAEDAAERGLTRGGRSRNAVLGHTRAAALEAAGSAAPPPDGPFDSVMAAALALAATRPPVERAVVDLEGRHGLARSAFARALGVAPAGARARAAAVGQAWADELDPALMAWLGPGDCEELAAVLPGPDQATNVRELLAAAPAVAAHTDSCDACADRRRALVSVRSLVVQHPLAEAPARLQALARAHRRRPSLPPPPLERRRPRNLVKGGLAGLLAGAVAVAAVLGVHAIQRRDRDRTRRVEALTALPAGAGTLTLSASTFNASTGTVDLGDRSARSVRWRAVANVPWLTVSPAAGQLAPGDSVSIRLRILDTAPEGDLKAAVTFTADNGDTLGLVGAGTIEHPPDLAARRTRCSVVARAEDEGKVASVMLHWREARVERTIDLAGDQQSQDYRGALPPTATSWWVTAVDARGNVASTPEERLPTPAC